jgi:hypothetical protein
MFSRFCKFTSNVLKMVIYKILSYHSLICYLKLLILYLVKLLVISCNIYNVVYYVLCVCVFFALLLLLLLRCFFLLLFFLGAPLCGFCASFWGRDLMQLCYAVQLLFSLCAVFVVLWFIFFSFFFVLG